MTVCLLSSVTKTRHSKLNNMVFGLFIEASTIPYSLTSFYWGKKWQNYAENIACRGDPSYRHESQLPGSDSTYLFRSGEVRIFGL